MSPRSLTLPLLAGLLAAAPTLADDQIVLTGVAVSQWADARLQPRSQRPQPLLLRFDNASGTATDEALVQSADDAGDLEQGGVPLSFLQAVVAGQLAASGRVERVANRPEALTAAAETAQLHIRLLEYRPAFRRGEEGSWSQGLASQWFSWQEEDPQPVSVVLAADWQRRPGDAVRRVTVRVQSDTCQTLPYAAGYLPGAAGTTIEQAEIGDGNSGHRQFAGHFQRSSIGQATLAALHQLLAWLDDSTTELPQVLTVTAIRGERLQWQDPRGYLRRGDELPLYHRDNPERRIGQVRIENVADGMATGHAITLAAGSVRPGDHIRLTRPVEAPLIVPASAPLPSRCPNTTTNADTQAADTPASASMLEPASEEAVTTALNPDS